MQKRWGLSAVLVLGVLSIIIWIYWGSNFEPRNGLTILKTSNDRFIRNLLIEPFNKTCRRKPLVIIIVTSYVGHVELRSAHRRSMPQDLLDSMTAVRIFLLAKIPPHERYITQNSIEDESNTFGDILQGSFVENYRNLTSKNLMGLQWASKKCDRAVYILKVDDDTVFNLERTYKLLTSMQSHGNFLMGHRLTNGKPERKKQNKWFVSWEEYSRNDYPPYLSGWYYITTPKVAAMITNEAIYHPLFWIDDVFITGLLTEALNIKLVQLPNGFWLEHSELVECCVREMTHKKIMCDAAIGPSSGRNNLIVEFNDAITICQQLKNCTIRTDEISLTACS